MPHTIEQQEPLNCAVHAINNALQRRLVSPQDAIDNIKKRFEKIVNFRASRKRAITMPLRITIDQFIAQETQDGFRIDDLLPTLKKHGYCAKFFFRDASPPTVEQLLLGSWVIMGQYPHFGHAIALCDGHVIESITQREPHPYHLLDRESPWPDRFVPRVFMRLDETTPPTVFESTDESTACRYENPKTRISGSTSNSTDNLIPTPGGMDDGRRICRFFEK